MGFHWEHGKSLSGFAHAAREPLEDVLRDLTEAFGRRAVEVTVANTPIERFQKRIAFRDAHGRAQMLPAELRRHLRDSITLMDVVAIPAPSIDQTLYTSGAETDIPWAPFVEEGTGLWGPEHAEYVIRPKRPGGWLSWITPTGFTRKDGTAVQPGARVFAKEVRHPGSPGNHMFAIGVDVAVSEFEEIAAPFLDRWAREAEALA